MTAYSSAFIMSNSETNNVLTNDVQLFSSTLHAASGFSSCQYSKKRHFFLIGNILQLTFFGYSIIMLHIMQSAIRDHSEKVLYGTFRGPITRYLYLPEHAYTLLIKSIVAEKISCKHFIIGIIHKNSVKCGYLLRQFLNHHAPENI